MNRAIVLALAALAAGSQLAAQSVTARVGGELTGFPSSAVGVPITVDMSTSGGLKLGSYTARLTWDPAALQYCPSCAGDTLRGNFPVPQVNSDSVAFGILKFTAVAPSGVDGLITIGLLPFSLAYDGASSALTLTFSEMSASGTFQNLLPILTVVNGTFCGAAGRWGDVDKDGRANSRDALMVLSRVVGLPLDSLANGDLGDVDADGRVTSRDALIILSYAVGLDVSGQRVLLLVPLSCGTGSAQSLAVLPAAAELVVGQLLQLDASAIDSAGRAVAISGLAWRSSDPAVAGVNLDGVVQPRAAGSVTITAELGPGLRASTSLTVVARRPNWYVDIRATGNPVQLGTQTYPYEHPFHAFGMLGEGDTVRVAPGTYLFQVYGALNVGAVIIGGTPGDSTTRPVFRGPANGSVTGLWLRGGNRTEVHNVAFVNFDEAIDLDGVRNFVMEDGRVDRSSYGLYSCTGVAMDTVRVERSVFLGDSLLRSGYAMYYSGCADPVTARVTVVRDTKIRFWYDAIYLYGADSLAVVGSAITDNAGDGIYLSQEYSELPALYVAHSRVERNTYGAISGYDLRRVVVDTSVVRQAGAGSTIDVGGPYSGPPMELYLHGDSLYVEGAASDYNWLDADYADSVVVDGTTVRFPADTASFWVWGYVEADVVRVTNSRFLNAGAGDVLDFTGRRFFANGVTMTGCAVSGCDQANGFELTLSGPGASSSVVGSGFLGIRRPVYAEGAGSVHEARFLTIDSTLVGIEYSGVDSVAVTDNAIRRVYGVYPSLIGAGVHVLSLTAGSGRGPSLFARDTVDCGAALEYAENGLDLNNGAFVVDGNDITGCREGIYVGSSRPGVLVQRNRVRSSVFGVDLYQGDTLTVTVDANAISATDSAAVRMFNGRVQMSGNRIYGNGSIGFHVPYSSGRVHVLRNNAFQGNAWYAVSSISDSVDASANWWGLDGMEPVPGTGTDSVEGRVNGTPPLASAPPAASLPLTPPAWRLTDSPRRVVAAAPASPARAERPTRTARPRVREPRQLPSAAGSSPERLARLQSHRERETARWRAEDQRRTEREERRARLAAERRREGTTARP